MKKQYENLEFEQKIQNRRIRKLSKSKDESVQKVGEMLCHHPLDHCGHPSCIWCRHKIQLKVKAAAWEKFKELPFDLINGSNIHFLTVNLCEIPQGISSQEFKIAVTKERNRLRRILYKNFSDELMVTGGIEISPREENGTWLLHVHLIVGTGVMCSIRSVREVLVRNYPGPNQVRVDTMHQDKTVEVNVKNCIGYSIKASWTNTEKDDALFEEYVALTEVIRSGATRGWTFSFGLTKIKEMLDEYHWHLTVNLWQPVFGNKRADHRWWTNTYWKERVITRLKKLGMWSGDECGMNEVDFFEDMGGTSSETTSENRHSIDNSGIYKPVEKKVKNPLKKYFSNKNVYRHNFGDLKCRIIEKVRETARKRAEADPPTGPNGGWFF